MSLHPRNALILVTLGCTATHAVERDPGEPVPDPGEPASDDGERLLDDAPAAPAAAFTETYDTGTMDVGSWVLTSDPRRPRMILPFKGNPDGFLYSEVNAPIPGWSTASTRYQPAGDSTFKRDSVFVGDYAAGDIGVLTVDLQVVQVGVWTPDRTVTVRLRRWNDTKNNIAYDATFSLPNIPAVPTGWNHYEFPINARSPTVPPGWLFRRGDGLRGTDADWAIFMQRVDLVAFELGRPGSVYPNLGLWKLAIDNVHIGSIAHISQ